MCGVVGLISETERNDLGAIASELLKALEYRGYDSTGAAVQSGDHLTLLKSVGAPSVVTKDLGIDRLKGKAFCGQVRWATFGAVDEINAQPHEVRCKTFIYGAHNGNVTNTEQLKEWLVREGHSVLSDNDGEILIHLIEHFFHLELQKSTSSDVSFRTHAMRTAICRASEVVEGSFAAVVIDPVTVTGWGIKSGSSLYSGIAMDPDGKFIIVSSDLSSILRYTKILIPLSEGQFIEFTHDSYRLFYSSTNKGHHIAGDEVFTKPVRSKLRHTDTELKPPYKYFMEQEIASQSETALAVINKFSGGSAINRKIIDILSNRVDLSGIKEVLHNCTESIADSVLSREHLDVFLNNDIIQQFHQIYLDDPETFPPLPHGNEALSLTFSSGEASLLADFLNLCANKNERFFVRLLDALFEKLECDELAAETEKFSHLINNARRNGNHIYLAACGTSYHAAMAACLFFNEIAATELIPILPGEFRGRYSNTVKDNDVVIAVSQSGETKDLIDILNDISATGHKVHTVGIVNNINSTIAQEKSDIVIPLRCGPEIAVPATKSFINQITVFYTLALSVGLNTAEEYSLISPEKYDNLKTELNKRLEKLNSIPRLIEETAKTSSQAVREAASNIYMAPSIQILATRINAVAREGALKIREVVLNHSEGFEGAEFKHGPNTILGFNTVFGYDHFMGLLGSYNNLLDTIFDKSSQKGLSIKSVKKIVSTLSDFYSGKKHTFVLSREEEEVFIESTEHHTPLSDINIPYPLIYITGPDERDVRLTISQINTHKIRGSSTIMIAEENPGLRTAAEKTPAGSSGYWSNYIVLPRTGDTLLAVFTSTIVLQMLALEMSVKKMEFLDKLGIASHGVHPDVPKNVSKSITVD